MQLVLHKQRRSATSLTLPGAMLFRKFRGRRWEEGKGSSWEKGADLLEHVPSIWSIFNKYTKDIMIFWEQSWESKEHRESTKNRKHTFRETLPWPGFHQFIYVFIYMCSFNHLIYTIIYTPTIIFSHLKLHHLKKMLKDNNQKV